MLKYISMFNCIFINSYRINQYKNKLQKYMYISISSSQYNKHGQKMNSVLSS